MKWFFRVLVILTALAIVAGLVVLVVLSVAPQPKVITERAPKVATVQRMTVAPRPTLLVRATVTTAPTKAPTQAATTAPTEVPTEEASTAPTKALTQAATAAPTKAPTKESTAAPTAAPTDTATAVPTLVPTKAATAAPTKAATMVPTKAPTQAAKAAVTVAPTKAATTAPTQAPTKTARPTRTATAYPIRIGWTDHTAADFRLALPERWKAIDVTEGGIEAVLDEVEELDSEWADRIREMYSTEDLQQIIKFWAMDTKAVEGTYANVNVGAQEVPESITLTEVVKQISAGFKQAGGQVIASSYRARINGLDAARLTLRMRVGSVTVQEYTYLYKRGNKMWVVTYAVDQKYWNTYMSTFDSSARSFRAD